MFVTGDELTKKKPKKCNHNYRRRNGDIVCLKCDRVITKQVLNMIETNIVKI